MIPWPKPICDKAYNTRPSDEQLVAVKAHMDAAMGVGTLLHKDYTPDKPRVYSDNPIVITSYSIPYKEAIS